METSSADSTAGSQLPGQRTKLGRGVRHAGKGGKEGGGQLLHQPGHCGCRDHRGVAACFRGGTEESTGGEAGQRQGEEYPKAAFDICLQDLGARLRFAVVGPDDLDIVNRLLYATYHPYEPLTKHLNLCKGLNSLKDVDRMVEEKLAKYLTL